MTTKQKALFHAFLAVLMVSTGSINTLATKWADELKGPNKRLFNHPFVQATVMFIGEFLCLLAYFTHLAYRRYRYRPALQQRLIDDESDLSLFELSPPQLSRINPFIFLPPAICDILGTSIMYIGLNWTHASSFQMLRGSIIIFTGLLSVAFLRSVLQPFRWLGMAFVVVGLLVVGLADFAFGSKSVDDVNGVITGDLLIVMAQIIGAIHVVYEQKYIGKYDAPPLLVVGLEGLFGTIILVLLMLPMYFIHVPSAFSSNPLHRLEDAIDAFRQMIYEPLIVVALSASLICIPFFNYAGVSVTKHMSSTTRTVIDSVRTPIIWTVSLLVGWQRFVWLQLIGFALLIVGMFVYNDILFGPFVRRTLMPWLAKRRLPMHDCSSAAPIDPAASALVDCDDQ